LIATHAEQQANGSYAILGAGTDSFASVARADLSAESQTRIEASILGSDVAFHILARFKLPRHEMTRGHVIEADIVDADGTSVHKITVNVPPLTMPAGASQQSELGVVAHLQVRLSPRRFGPYTAALYADTAPVKQIAFQIVQSPPPA
jgi:hypothetical protein